LGERIIKINKSPHFGIYGGSFDPPHFGHVMIAAYILSHFHIDKLLIIPCASHPFQKSLSSFNDRMEMCKRAFGIIDSSKIVISSIEQELSAPSYTIKTVQKVIELNPETKLSLFIGSDVEKNLPNWYKIDELKCLVDICVLPRTGFICKNESLLFPNISSTMIREAIMNKQNASKWLDHKVYEYVLQQNLYQKDS